MNMELLTKLLMWCTLINGSLLIFWTVMCMTIPDTVYRLQTKWFPMSRDSYELLMYSFLGLFKVIFLVFNLVPYVALLIVG